MLWTSRRLVLQLVESVGYVAGHGHVHSARLVVPIELKVAVTVTGQVGGEGIERRNGINEMLGVFAACVLYSKIMNNQTEFDGKSSMGEETGSVLCL
jgi:hypothetical protein